MTDHCQQTIGFWHNFLKSLIMFDKNQIDLRWEEMYRKSEQTALGSQDAMILNLLDASIIPFVVTMDFDLAYGVLASTQHKVALVPDNLYRNRLKKTNIAQVFWVELDQKDL
jgi:hypothetical protein